MNYNVIWTSEASNELARLWLDSELRNEIESAANAIDQYLRVHPTDPRCELFDGDGTLIRGRLGVDFHLIEPDRMVKVFKIWLVDEE